MGDLFELFLGTPKFTNMEFCKYNSEEKEYAQIS